MNRNSIVSYIIQFITWL